MMSKRSEVLEYIKMVRENVVCCGQVKQSNNMIAVEQHCCGRITLLRSDETTRSNDNVAVEYHQSDRQNIRSQGVQITFN